MTIGFMQSHPEPSVDFRSEKAWSGAEQAIAALPHDVLNTY